MTNSLVLEVGTRLKLRIDQRGRYIGGYSSAATIPADTEVEIRKVGTSSIWVRGAATVYGFSVSKSFKARSKKLAEKMFDEELVSVVTA